jgi:hypothetical protein
LFQTQSDSLLAVVEIKDNDIDLLIQLNNLFRMLDTTPAEVCDMDKTINTTEIDPALPSGLNIVTGQPLAKTVNVAMSNTFGFGGHNGIVVFKKFTE